MNANSAVNNLAASRRCLAGALLLVCGLSLAPAVCRSVEGADGPAAGSAVPPGGSSRLLFTEFRKPPADEGWEARGNGKEPARIEVIAVAADPDEHGVRIEKGTLAGPRCAVQPLGYYRLRFRAKTERKA